MQGAFPERTVLKANEEMQVDDLDFERVMVIFAHPDDAEVQCAGTVALWAGEGKKIAYVVLTKGDKGTQDPSMAGDRLTDLRQQEQLKAAGELGVGKVLFLPNDDGVLEVNLERRKVLTRIIREHQPEVLITHDPWMRSSPPAIRSISRSRSRRG